MPRPDVPTSRPFPDYLTPEVRQQLQQDIAVYGVAFLHRAQRLAPYEVVQWTDRGPAVWGEDTFYALHLPDGRVVPLTDVHSIADLIGDLANRGVTLLAARRGPWIHVDMEQFIPQTPTPVGKEERNDQALVNPQEGSRPTPGEPSATTSALTKETA